MNKLPSDGLRTVKEDLDLLIEKWQPGELTPAAMRQASGVLRRLLGDERLLLRAWQTICGTEQLMIPAKTLEDSIAGIPLDRLLLAVAAGGIYRGPKIESLLLVLGGGGASAPNRPPSALTFQRFVDGACMQVRGASISRRHVIDYVANKLGGVHFDPSRSKKEHDALDLVARSSMSAGEIQLLIAKGGLPLVTVEISVDDGVHLLDPVYLALLSIGYWVAESPQVQLLASNL